MDVFDVILCICIISVVPTECLRLNVTRQNTGDILSFGEKVDCASLNARCLPKDKREIGRNICERCKCLSRYTSYASIDKQCVNINGIADLKCRTLHKQIPLMDKSTNEVGWSIEARHCRSLRYPQVLSIDTDGTTWSWDRTTGIDISLTSSMKNNSRYWQVSFEPISRMLIKYTGRIAKIKISCTTGDVCIIFKIAGSLVGNSTVAKHPNDPYSPDSSQPTTFGTTLAPDHSTPSPNARLRTTERPSSNHTVGNENLKSGKNYQTIWIIVVAVLIVIVLVITTVLAFICYRRKKTRESNHAEHPRRDIDQHEYDVPIILNSTNKEGHGRNENKEVHVYETCSDKLYANSPPECTHYQELNHNDRDRDPSNLYQPLVKPVQRVHPNLDDKARYTEPTTNDNEYESMSPMS